MLSIRRASFTLALASAAAWVALAPPAAARTVTYTLDADFDVGEAVNVEHVTVSDQLQLSSPPIPHPYIWVACSQRGTIVKIDVANGAVLGEYLTSPDGRLRNPSRTSVDRLGNAWVGNRNEASPTFLVGADGRPFTLEDGSVMKVGLLEAGQCVDRNGNGVIDTSTGLGDVRAWANAGDVDSLGGTSTAADECILLYVRVDPPHVRQVSIDLDENVWVGGDSTMGLPDRKFQLLHGSTGLVLRTIDMNDPTDTGVPPLFPGFAGAGYGGFVDCHGHLWSTSSGGRVLLRVDTSLPNGNPALTKKHELGMNVYGIGHAPDGSVWISTWTNRKLFVFDDDLNLIAGPYPTTGIPGSFFGSRGVAVTPVDSHVWVANSDSGTVTRHAPDGSIVAVIGVGEQPTGVAVDSAGKVWVTNFHSHGVMRLDPATNAVDLTVDLFLAGHPVDEGAAPYNYSDMTGIMALQARPYGRWSVVTDAGCAGFTWTSVSWNGSEPPATELVVEARSAADAASLEAATFAQVGNGAPLSGFTGRLLETRVNFRTEAGAACDGQVSPVLHDLSVHGQAVSAPLISCPADVVAECVEPTVQPALAESECGTVELSVVTERTDGTCAFEWVLEHVWTATDQDGLSATCTQRIEVRDSVAPELLGVPADTTAECGLIPEAPDVTAIDACDPAPLVEPSETIEPGDCPGSHVVVRTWTAEDACGNTASLTQRIEVQDSTPPALAGVPADTVAECGQVPDPPAVTASDACDPEPEVEPTETIEPGDCPDEHVVVRTWTAEDACGNTASLTQRIEVRDTAAPAFVETPGDLVVECGQPVPPPPDLLVQDACDPDPEVDFVESILPGGCPGQKTLLRLWTATDRCGASVSTEQRVEIHDTTPPVLEAAALPSCIWPPNHRYLCFTDIHSLVATTDTCPGVVQLEVTGCDSDQPEDQQGPDDRGINGDGNTVDDCVVADDGTGFCIRSERLGQCKAGRTYGVTVKAVDGCGNAGEIVLALHVPHDQREHPQCAPLRPQEFLLPHEPIPFAWTSDPDPDAGLPHPFHCQ